MNINFSLKLVKISALVAGIFLATSSAFSEDKKSIEELTSGNKTAEVGEKSRLDESLKTHSFGLGLGQTFLKEDFKKNGDSEIGFDFYYNYSASHSFDMLLNIHKSTYEKGSKETELFGFAPSIKAKIFNFDNFAPVAFAGLGFYRPKITGSEAKTVFGYHFGGGAELRLNEHFMTGVLLHLHNPFDVDQPNGTKAVEGWYYKLLLTIFYTL